jgi:hypothetical protein
MRTNLSSGSIFFLLWFLNLTGICVSADEDVRKVPKSFDLQ